MDTTSTLNHDGSPQHNSFLLARSAPTTIPTVNPLEDWSHEMFGIIAQHNSYDVESDPLLLSGMDIPRATASRLSHVVSPFSSCPDVREIESEDAFITSFSSSYSLDSLKPQNEPFPAYQESDQTWSTSPTQYNSHFTRAAYDVDTFGNVDAANLVNKTTSVLSNDSFMSREADEMFDMDEFPAGNLGGDVSVLNANGSMISTVKPRTKVSGLRKGRKRKLSAAERESTAYMRRIQACDACKERKMKVWWNRR